MDYRITHVKVPDLEREDLEEYVEELLHNLAEAQEQYCDKIAELEEEINSQADIINELSSSS